MVFSIAVPVSIKYKNQTIKKNFDLVCVYSIAVMKATHMKPSQYLILK